MEKFNHVTGEKLDFENIIQTSDKGFGFFGRSQARGKQKTYAPRVPY